MGTQDTASQQVPRPLPLFLELLRSETAADPARRAKALRGLAAYQQAPRTPRLPFPPAVATVGRIRLHDFGGSGPTVILVPSLINPPFVLDLTPNNSLARWLASNGLRVMLIDWGTPGPDDASMDVGAHASAAAMLIAALPEPPLLVGYCLGGTIALAAAALVPVAGIALIATPWRFSGFDAEAHASLARLWDTAAPTSRALGRLPMEALQAGFWQLDPARTVAKFEGFADRDPDDVSTRAFVALEDWANGGAPLPHAAAHELFEDMFAADLPGRNRWRVEGHVVTLPSAIPAVEFVAADDRIVPAASAAHLPDSRIVPAGHVGMVIGRRGRPLLWQPLLDWLIAAGTLR